MADQTVKMGADISELEAAARQAITLFEGQNAAIKSLIVSQYNANIENEKYNAIVKITLDSGKQVTSTLRLQGDTWEVVKQKVTQATAALTEQEKATKQAELAARRLAQEAKRRADEEDNAIKRIINAVKQEEKEKDQFAKNEKKRKQEQENNLNKFLNITKRSADIANPIPTEPADRKAFLGVGDLARIAEATLFKTALNNVTSAFGEGIAKAKEYQIQISLIRTVSQDAQLSFGQWSKGIRDVSDKLGIDLVDTAKAAYDAIQSQVVTGPQTLKFLETAGNLARTTGTNIKQSGDLLASVIQGFNQSITQADDTAAKLFKTVELGRIQVSELTNTMGKVAPSANVLGISFEEVAASLSTLTRQGIKTTDATTLVTNVIVKLAKPTEALKGFIQSLGFSSSEAAIKTLGFAGVLRELEKATSGGKLEELAVFFNELRGLRGAVGLTSVFGDFEKDLKEIDNAQATFLRAQEIRAESSSDKLTKFAQNVKNVFAEEFAQTGLKIAEGIIGPLGTGEVAARAFGVGMLSLVSAIALGKAAMIAYGIANQYATAAAIKQGAATAANTAGQIAYNEVVALGGTVQQASVAQQQAAIVAQKAYTATQAEARVAMTNSIGTLALVTAAVAGLSAVWLAYNDDLKSATYNTESNLQRIAESVRNVSADNVKDVAVSNLKTFESFVKASFKAPLAASAEAYRAVSQQLTVLETQGKSLGEGLGISYKGFLDNLHEGVKVLNHDITQANQNIKLGRKEAIGFKDSLDDIIRNTQLKYATEQQKLDLTEQNIVRLRKEVQTLFLKGDEESLKSGERKLNEIAKLIEGNFDRSIDATKRQQEEFLRANPGQASLGTTITVSTVPLQQRLNELLQFRNGLQKENEKIQDSTIAKSKKQIEDKKEDIRKLEVSAKKLIDFDVFDKSGKPKEEFTTNGKFDESKVKAELAKLADEIVKIQPDAGKTFDFYEKMYARIDNIVLTANAKTNQGLIEQDQKRLTATQDLLIKNFKGSQDKIAKASSSSFSKDGALDLLQQDAKSLADFTSAGPNFVNKFFNLNNLIDTTIPAATASKKVEEDVKAYIAASDRIKSNANNVQGQLIPRKEDIDASSAALETLKGHVADYIKIYSAAGLTDQQISGILLPRKDGKNITVGDILADLEKQKKVLSDASNTGDTEGANTDKLFKDLLKFQKDATVPLLKEFPTLGSEGVKATDAVKGSVDELNKSLQQAVESVTRLKEGLKALPAPTEKINAETVNDQASYFATGGHVFPGSPKGKDTIPAWLSPGEFVVSAENTRRFYAQLVDMNRGKKPQYFSNGGIVTNNVGDVHVTVNGSDVKSPARVGRAVGNEIRRELRRGNLRNDS